MPEFIQDRRKHRDRRESPREAADGTVEISFSAPALTVVKGVLVETSASGFRASHDCEALEPGLEVQYLRTGSRGSARVIWTHVLEGRRVSGFLVI